MLSVVPSIQIFKVYKGKKKGWNNLHEEGFFFNNRKWEKFGSCRKGQADGGTPGGGSGVRREGEVDEGNLGG